MRTLPVLARSAGAPPRPGGSTPGAPALRGLTARASRLGLGALAVLAVLALAGRAPASDALSRVEDSFRFVADRARRATVVVVPRGVSRAEGGFSSGVLVSAEGLVLTDGDAGVMWRRAGDGVEKVRLDDVEVRRADGNGGYRAWPARVVARSVEADTALVRVLGPPAGGFPFVPVGRSAELEPGRFVIAAGVAFDDVGSTPPTVTAGLVASADPAPKGAPVGPWTLLYTTAALNQGMNGGGVVSLDGQLVGTVSSWVDPGPDQPQQLLGRVVPIDRIRAAVGGAESRALAPASPEPAGETARALEHAVGVAARAARAGVVSLVVRRRRPISGRTPALPPGEALPRWRGPVSGLLVDEQGGIATSLYDLTDVAELVYPLWRPPEGASVADGLDDVLDVEAWFPSGAHGPARLVGHDDRTGVALLEVEEDVARRSGAHVVPAAPTAALAPGRFVVAVGDPFGPERRPLPLVSFGILSKKHPDDGAVAWRGEWQTDASGIDSNCGGAVVDIDGGLVGMLQLWHPGRHGRSSGVAFVVPAERLIASAADIRRGRVPAHGFLGVRFASGDVPTIETVVPASAADRAGLAAGDVVYRVDDDEVATVEDAVDAVAFRYAGETVEMTVRRRGALLTVPVTLGQRP